MLIATDVQVKTGYTVNLALSLLLQLYPIVLYVQVLAARHLQPSPHRPSFHST